jgi:AcrR family transcriptional regulator
MLSPEAVIDAGVELVRDGGLAGLGIRSLADRLGVTPMALYRHVDTAQALEEQVVAAILGQISPASSEQPWDAAARAWAVCARPIFVQHPGVARYVLTHWFRLPSVLDWLESLLAAAERDGVVGLPAVAAVNAVFTYVLMRAEAEEAIRRAKVVERRLPRGARSDARWPRLKANAPEYEVAKLDVHFTYGLDVILFGIDRRQNARA